MLQSIIHEHTTTTATIAFDGEVTTILPAAMFRVYDPAPIHGLAQTATPPIADRAQIPVKAQRSSAFCVRQQVELTRVMTSHHAGLSQNLISWRLWTHFN